MQDFFDNYIFFIPLCCLCQRSEFSKKKTKIAFHSFWNIHYECDNVKASKKHCFFQYLYYYYNLLSLTLWHSFNSFFYYETTILFVTFWLLRIFAWDRNVNTTFERRLTLGMYRMLQNPFQTNRKNRKTSIARKRFLPNSFFFWKR